MAEYIKSGIDKAEEQGAQAVLIRLDTPGGGYEPMRQIVTRMLEARVPVIVFVPNGGRAASAGTFITLAAHVAAMAPVSNIGSAHPVLDVPGGGDQTDSVSKTMMTKIVNDSAAYIVTIAERRGRNAKWAEDAVRKSVNVKATDAVRLGVIDFTADSIPQVLDRAEGRTVRTAAGDVTLRTKGAKVEVISMGWVKEFLQVLGNPLVAYLLMLVAILGIIFEINTPGATFPGVIGVVAFILLLFSFSVIPISTAGVVLVLLGLGLFVIDLKVPSHGVFTTGAIISFFIGSMMLFASNPTVPSVPVATIAAGTLAIALFFIFLVGWGAQALKMPVVTGARGMIGKIVEARTDIAPTGQVFAEGTLWRAWTDGPMINKGEMVRIIEMSGLKVRVERVQSAESGVQSGE
jgi:membrane-bound serine protease (ClpP class)